MVRRYARWLVKGLAAELYSNLRPGARYAGPPLAATARGRTALVTGGTGAIGEAVCRGLAARGYDVVVGARDAAAGSRVAEALARDYGVGARCAVADLDRLEAFAAADVAGLSLVVNNAGVMGASRAATYRVNVIAPARCAAAALAKNPRCRVVNVASSSHLRAAAVRVDRLADDAADATLAAYAESKLGLVQVTAALAAAGHDVVACHPGLVWTPMLRGFLGGPLCGALETLRLRGRLFRTPDEGAATVLAACDPRVAPRGSYVVDGAPRPRLASPEARAPPPPALWDLVFAGDAAPLAATLRVRVAGG